MLTLGSVYSGIGGLELGIIAAFREAHVPIRLAWQIENDPFCARVLAARFPSAVRFSDVASVSHPPVVDVLCGGFACQDVSAAGKGAGLGPETRSGHTLLHLLRLIDETRPRIAVVENVASGAKRWLPRVVQELRDRGYRPRAVPLEAAHVGAPHRRARVFVVADRDVQRCEGERRCRVPDDERQALGNHTDRCCREVADAPGGGRPSEGERLATGHAHGLCDLRQRTTTPGEPEPCVGDDSHGLPYDVVGHQFPAPRGDEQHAWEPPRSIGRDVTIADRRAKLRALGNAVVPQCAVVIGRIVVQLLGVARVAKPLPP